MSSDIVTSEATPALRRAEFRGHLPVGDIRIPCFVLEDGTRVISGRGFTQAIGMQGRGQGAARIPAHRTLRRFMTAELIEDLENPIRFVGSTSRSLSPTTGYEATILLSVCEVILQARDADALQTLQEQRYALHADILVRAFAKVGIIALVDEATGYQDVRARDELNKILEAYVAKELLPWAKRFPDEFYKEIFRLRGWKYNPKSVKRPSFVGKLTNELVYNQLPPPVLADLRAKNPVVTPGGRRRHKHHQFLTSDVGHPHLEKHLASVITLMRVAPNWSTFYRLFNRAFPKHPVQEELDFMLDDDDL